MTYVHNKCELIFAVTLLLILLMLPNHALSLEQHLYSTGPLKEIDRCGSAWLIKRYVDKNAVFRFYPEGELITEGMAFDTPEAKLRRTHRHSTFEAILLEYNLSEEKLQELANIIHDIEVNAWEKRKEYREILHQISQITDRSKTDEQRLDGCLKYFDSYWEAN